MPRSPETCKQSAVWQRASTRSPRGLKQKLGSWPRSKSASARDERLGEQAATLDLATSHGLGRAPCQSEAVQQIQDLLLLDDRQLSEAWPHVGGPRALFLDYDGTLREFEACPELAVPTDEIRSLLIAINMRSDFEPYIISGRDSSFLEQHFGWLSRFTLIAEHGLQIWRPGHQCWRSWGRDDHQNWKGIMRVAMMQIVHDVPGSHLEEKRSALVWHYRAVPDVVGEPAARLAVQHLEALAEFHKLCDVRVANGAKVVEVSYNKVCKGSALQRICHEKCLLGTPYSTILAAGDDLTDETMFEAAPDGAMTIKVGTASTSAKFRVKSPMEFRSFLWRVVLDRPTW